MVKKEKKILPRARVRIVISPIDGEFLGTTEETIFDQVFTHYMAPIAILEMAHFQFNKNWFLDQDKMKDYNEQKA